MTFNYFVTETKVNQKVLTFKKPREIAIILFAILVVIIVIIVNESIVLMTY